MSGEEDWLTRYHREQAERQSRSAELVRYISPMLRFLGIDQVRVPFDGYGDDGEIQPPILEPMPTNGLPEGLHDLLGEACQGQLPGGWEINAGSFGEIVIDARSGKVVADIEWREDDEDDWDPDEDPEEN